jgi:hypothetical protein
MARKKRDPMLGMSLRERTQERARKARMEAAARRKAAAEQARKDKEAEAARKAAPANENKRKQLEGGGMGKPKPKPQPAAPASKPKPKQQPAASKPKPKPQPAASKPEPAKATKPNPNENPDRVNKTLSNGSPNPRHPMYDGAAGFQRYNRDRAAWEKKQKQAARGRVNRRGRRIRN